MCTALTHVRFTPESGHVQCTRLCPLWAKSGHGSTPPAFGWSAFAATRGSTGSTPQKIHSSISGFSFTRELDRQNKLEQRAIFAIRRRSQLTAMMFDNHAAYG